MKIFDIKGDLCSGHTNLLLDPRSLVKSQKNALKIALFCLVGCVFLGCKTQYIEKEVYIERRDTIIRVESDTIENRIFVECDSDLIPVIVYKDSESDGRMHIKSSSALVDKTLQITNTAYVDSLQMIIEALRESKIEVQRVTEYVEKPIPGYYKFCSWAFWVIVIGALLCIVVRVLIRVYLHK